MTVWKTCMWGLAFAAVCFAVVYGAYAEENRFETQMLQPVVKINQNCSGSIVSSEKGEHGVKTQILTAKHCISGREGQFNIEKMERGKPLYTLNIWYDLDRVDVKNDLALVTLRDMENVYPVVKIADEERVKPGDDVYVSGYPSGEILTITRGMFTGYYMVKDMVFYRATPALTYGNSGGALFHQYGDDYTLIGVTSMKRRDNEFMNLFVPLEEIRKFLKVPDLTKVTIDLPPIQYPGPK